MPGADVHRRTRRPASGQCAGCRTRHTTPSRYPGKSGARARGTLFSYSDAHAFPPQPPLRPPVLRRQSVLRGCPQSPSWRSGIGASTAVFSVVKGVLLTPLPFREPDRVVLFRADVPGYVHQAALNREEFYALRDRSELFESVGVINESPGSLTSPDHMEAVTAASASDNFLADARRDADPRPHGHPQGRRQGVRQRRHHQLRPVGAAIPARSERGRPRRSKSTTCRCGSSACCRRTSTCISAPASSRRRSTSGIPRPLSYDDDDPFRGRIVDCPAEGLASRSRPRARPSTRWPRGWWPSIRRAIPPDRCVCPSPRSIRKSSAT